MLRVWPALPGNLIDIHAHFFGHRHGAAGFVLHGRGGADLV